MQKTRDQLAEYLFHQGTNYRSYAYLGAHRLRGGGYVFRVWAPNADAVFLTGDFNGWGDDTPMEKQPGGVWTASLPEARFGEGGKYKFLIERSGVRRYKADPYAFCSETGDKTASVYCALDGYEWRDGAYMESRSRNRAEDDAMPPLPVNIYEVHLGSWKRRPDGSYLTYRELADELSAYAADMGYTHVELMPVAEHPFDGSWGYQVCGYYAPTSRFGTPQDFMYFVDTMHARGLGVILDWVPAHFPKDAHGLYEFDGGPLYEYQGADRQEHREWGTRAFDVGRTEVQSFLVSNALFWFDKYHIDGLRIDAVASMLYLDYGRRPGEWNPNPDGSNINRESVAFFQKLNGAVRAHYPDVLMIAEESTAYPQVTSRAGLGFSMKWNMGWMNDTLAYVAADPIYRRGLHDKMTFSLMYAFSENYVLPISHDEVVYMKGSLRGKMPGDEWRQLAGVRSFMVYMLTHPGKKLTFMGAELGQWHEWDFAGQLDWYLLENDANRRMQDFFRAVNRYYLTNPALWHIDFDWAGFEWLVADDNEDNTVVFVRRDGAGEELLVAVNFSPNGYRDYRFGVPPRKTWREELSTDDTAFGGTGEWRNEKPVRTQAISSHGREQSIAITIPPLGAVILRGAGEYKKPKAKKSKAREELPA